MVEEEAVEEEAAEEGLAEEQQAAQPQVEETQNSSERSHLPSVEIVKTSTDSYQTFRGTCP